MGAFRYCHKCEASLGPPTPREDLLDGQLCPRCGTKQPQCKSIEEWLVELFEDIELLKEANKLYDGK